MARKRDSKGRFVKSSGKSKRRSRNPGTIEKLEVAGVKVKPAALDVVAVLAASYIAGSTANFINRQLVGRLPSQAQGVGYTAAAIGVVMAGVYAQKAIKSPIPLETVGIALSVPLVLKAAEHFRLPGYRNNTVVPAPPVETPAETAAGSLRPGALPGMGGSLQTGALPGMGGTIQSGYGPGMGMGRTSMRRVR